MQVTWEGTYYRFSWLDRRVSDPLSSIEDAIIVTVTTNAQGHQHPRFDLPTTKLRPAATPEDRTKEYGISNRFVALAVAGKLLRVDSITDRGDNPKNWASHTEGHFCRRYSVSFAESFFTGWASIEYPDYRINSQSPVYALIIAREQIRSYNGTVGRLLNTGRELYLVLYVREAEIAEAFRPSYERVGTGQIWVRQFIDSSFPSI